MMAPYNLISFTLLQDPVLFFLYRVLTFILTVLLNRIWLLTKILNMPTESLLF